MSNPFGIRNPFVNRNSNLQPPTYTPSTPPVDPQSPPAQETPLPPVRELATRIKNNENSEVGISPGVSPRKPPRVKQVRTSTTLAPGVRKKGNEGARIAGGSAPSILADGKEEATEGPKPDSTEDERKPISQSGSESTRSPRARSKTHRRTATDLGKRPDKKQGDDQAPEDSQPGSPKIEFETRVARKGIVRPRGETVSGNRGTQPESPLRKPLSRPDHLDSKSPSSPMLSDRPQNEKESVVHGEGSPNRKRLDDQHRRRSTGPLSNRLFRSQETFGSATMPNEQIPSRSTIPSPSLPPENTDMSRELVELSNEIDSLLARHEEKPAVENPMDNTESNQPMEQATILSPRKLGPPVPRRPLPVKTGVVQKSEQALEVANLTPGMAAAGAEVLGRFYPVDGATIPDEEVVARIFEAMMNARSAASSITESPL